ncbi:MAG TPA: substrate-binding domain-containing protein [Tepidisphaeraceae bacterium]|jgi:ribose transport system substrate-binding protein|nr:substrate-binding domain-containing protein [Tepidisphaeraceae bacterium]
MRWILTAALTAATCLTLAAGAHADDKKHITIGIVAKSQSNPVFQAAHQGARDAAKEFGDKYNVDVTVNIQTPSSEDAQKQADAIEQLARQGADGIAVSCSDANAVTPAIDKAVAAGAVVITFDSDAPRSKRLAYYGTDDKTCGIRVMDELAKVMDEKGVIAILAGNQAAPNLRTRAQAVRDEAAAKYPNIKIIDTYYHPETPEQAAAEVQREQAAHPEITGWAMIGGWPLFTRDALKWDPGTVKVVSVDALPPQLSYLEDGHVQVLLAQDCYGWGHKSVEMLLDQIVNGKAPPSKRVIDPLTKVTKENSAEFAKNWEKWLGK